jgi:chloramphenicol 3-O-phosphotransferase
VDLVFLHGPAAAGKLTVARALEVRVGFPVFHNHLVVDLLTTVFPFGTEPFVRLREEFWTAVFADATRVGRSICFTFAPEATVQPGFPERVRGLVEANGGRVRFVRLRVSEREQERRIGLPERSEFHKLTSVETLRQLRNYGTGVEQPPTDLEIDTDRRSPTESAAAIASHFGLTAQDPALRYPVAGD